MPRILTILALLSLPWMSTAAAQERLDIVASVPDLGHMAEVIGGDRVDVKVLIPAGSDPHAVLPKASLLLKLSRADGLIVMGLDYEHAFLPALLEKTRNKAVLQGGSGFMNVGARIQAKDVPETLDRSEGADLHPKGNPHFNLDPENGRIMAEAVRDLLVALAPQHRQEFDSRWKAWDEEAQRRIAVWTSWMAPLEGKEVVCYHESWVYFTDRFGMGIAGYVEPKPGLAPSAKHLLAVKKMMRDRGLKMILMEPWYNEARVKSLAGDGVSIMRLPSTSGYKRGQEAYLDFIESLVMAMREGHGLPPRGDLPSEVGPSRG